MNKKSTKTKIICLGCNKEWQNKIYSDGSYRHFYQDIKTKQYFCEGCIQDEPVAELFEKPTHLLFRNNQYFDKKNQECCAGCKEANLELTQEWNEKKYCQDCINWNREAERSEITGCWRYDEKFCERCCLCNKCLLREKKLAKFSTQELISEIINRPDYWAVITWEDDDFQHRIKEIAWELSESESMTPEEIETMVNEDIFNLQPSRRKKYSKGV
ncbi:hypothetical protein [endosymbiont GvMRE of Glomus versiforme]|uniref:hypothetical protein n=1 Tax=endosymbiont GvMRE of Glomus versiforme TaxID=2039283 RepID=UPI000ED89A59|nr:hypothetical protein [endosymbiont GvMRE of Glomus versiforme]RHZ37152.1 hypothetical protein GvMRE_I1g491 [endosymbiont GvMRE of Glomus versiforme]